MKALLTLIVLTLSLGSAISIGANPVAYYYIPLYILAAVHVYFINVSDGFFLVFLEKTMQEDIARVRLGATEIALKDESEKNEDKFLSLFDWKKTAVRKFLSWGVFFSSVYLLVFRLHIEVTLENIMPAIIALLLMGAVAVGHFLVPLAINLMMVLKDVPDFRARSWVLTGIYGILLVATLALIFPSEERLRQKLRDWPSGKWSELVRTLAVIVFAFCVGLFVFPKKFEEKKPPQIPREAISRNEVKLQHLSSSMENVLGNGLLQKNVLGGAVESLRRDMKEFENQETRSPEEWKKLTDRQEKLTKRFDEELSSGNTPGLTPELLEKMKADLKSRGPVGIDEKTFGKMQDLLKRMENFDGHGGSDLVREYRECKYGKGGYYREETELAGPVTPQPESEDVLKKMTSAAMKKKEVSDIIRKNVDALQENPDQGLQAVNDALKKELADADTFSAQERETAKQELARNLSEQQALLSRTKDQKTSGELRELMEKNQQILSQMTPHMNAGEKSALAGKIRDQKFATEKLKKVVRDEVAEQVQAREELIRKKEEAAKAETEESDAGKKLFRILAVLGGGLLVLWFLRLLGKKGVKKVSGVPEEVKEEIEERLAEVKRKNLSPREEIIETYNVLHDGLQALVFIHETPPSCIVYEGVRAAEPVLGGPTFEVTDIFARTFYGNREVSTTDLKTFRKCVRAVFKYFGIRG